MSCALWVNDSLYSKRFIARRDSPDLSQSPSSKALGSWGVSTLVSSRSFCFRPFKRGPAKSAASRSWTNASCLTRRPADPCALDELRDWSPCESLAGSSRPLSLDAQRRPMPFNQKLVPRVVAATVNFEAADLPSCKVMASLTGRVC